MTHDPLCPCFIHPKFCEGCTPQCGTCLCDLIAKAKRNQHWKSYDFGFDEGWEACKRESGKRNNASSTFSISRSTGLTVSSCIGGGKP